MSSALRVFQSRRMAVLAGLGFASGLPSVLVADTLQAWMAKSHVELPAIQLVAGVAGFPYALKFLWAAYLDRDAVPFLGRRRGWLVVLQVLVAAAIAGLGLCAPRDAIGTFAATAFLVALFSASQDVVADAYRTDVLEPHELGAGAAVYVAGYRVAMVASGAGALFLAGGGVSWTTVYAIAAAAMTVGVVATLCAPEPRAVAAKSSPNPLAAIFEPLRAFLAQPDGIAMLVFVAVFKLPDVIGAGYTTTFLIERGYSLQELAAARGLVGVGVAVIGTICGGAVVARAGLRRSLWIFGVLHALVNLGFSWLATSPPDLPSMTAVIVVENFCIGLATAGFMAFLMSRCDARFSAFQYALLTAIGVGTKSIAVALLGGVPRSVGWPWFFAGAALVGLPSLLLLPRLRLFGDQAADASSERRAR